MPSFAETLRSGRPASRPPPQPSPEAPAPAPPSIGADDALVDPRSGEVIDLTSAPPEQLIDVVLECRRREGLMQTWRRGCENELRRRLGDRKLAVFGDHEVRVDSGRGKEWDGVMLRDVILDLIDRSVLAAGEIPEGLVTTQVKVDGNAANRLLDRLQGGDREVVAECFRWVQKGRPRLTVNPVPDLGDALPEQVKS
jgi:hypothetical protein